MSDYEFISPKPGAHPKLSKDVPTVRISNTQFKCKGAKSETFNTVITFRREAIKRMNLEEGERIGIFRAKDGSHHSLAYLPSDFPGAAYHLTKHNQDQLKVSSTQLYGKFEPGEYRLCEPEEKTIEHLGFKGQVLMFRIDALNNTDIYV